MPDIMPQFVRHPKEATIIGHILAEYGELEYELCQCLRAAFGKSNQVGVTKAFFRLRTESQRIDMADALMRDAYVEAKLESQYAETIGAVRWCRKIRNQYAHCLWQDSSTDGLEFADLVEAAQSSSPMEPKFHVIGLALLQAQEEFFCYTAQCLRFLAHELAHYKNEPAPRSPSMPPKMPQPLKHNAPRT